MAGREVEVYPLGLFQRGGLQVNRSYDVIWPQRWDDDRLDANTRYYANPRRYRYAGVYTGYADGNWIFYNDGKVYITFNENRHNQLIPPCFRLSEGGGGARSASSRKKSRKQKTRRN
jgi:hypothetical protein